MNRVLWSFVLVAAAGAVCLPAQEAVFRTGVSLVRVDAQVTVGDMVVSGLEREDFVVTDQGQRADILYLTAEQEPLDLLLLLDVSGSMKDAIEQVSRVAGTALSQLREGDRVALASFTSNWRLVVPFTEDLDQIQTAVEVLVSQPFDGGTDILRTLDEAGMVFEREPRTARRRAMIMISDGKAPHYYRDEQTLKNLWRSGAVLHVLLVKSKAKESSLPIDMPKMAESTGGEAIRADRPGTAFQELMERIRRRYGLFYALPPGSPGEQRAVRVELAEGAKKRYPKAKVRARSGYVWVADAVAAGQ